MGTNMPISSPTTTLFTHMLDNQPKRNNHKTYAAVTVMLVPSDYCLQLTVGSDWSAASRVPSESAVPHVQREPPSAGDLPEHAQHPLWRSLHCGGTVGCDPGGGVTPPLPPAVPGLGATWLKKVSMFMPVGPQHLVMCLYLMLQCS